MEKTIIRRTLPTTECLLSSSLLHPILQNIYATRGIKTTADLERGLDNLLPFHELFGIETAVNCLRYSLEQQEKIIIIGDFDADGATSTALAVSALAKFGAKNIEFLVPNRFEFGYGLTPEIVAVAAKKSPQLIITVDNGISSCAGVDFAKSLGIKVLITDHHLPGNQLPNADAIVNPNQPDDHFASKNLAGVGVIFYVMLALRSKLRECGWFTQNNITEPNMTQFLDLVALGTVADVVPLDKNNRILVHQGLLKIQSGKCGEGIKALLTISQRQIENISATDLSFAIAPRLNAAGRLDDMSLGIACLLSNDKITALNMAAQLDALNRERREIEQSMQVQALSAINDIQSQKNQSLPFGMCLFEEDWHQGVIGIIAGRIKDIFHRPVIAFALADDEILKGSARSVAKVHIRDVLDAIATKNPELIVKFGGHAMAAGLTISRENYQAFSEAFATEVKNHLTQDDIQKRLLSDGELLSDDIHISFAKLLRDGGPWGQHFPEPLFDGVFNILQQRLVGGKHLKLILAHPENHHPIDAIVFGIDVNQWPNEAINKIHIAYRMDINVYRGLENIQLLIEYLEAV